MTIRHTFAILLFILLLPVVLCGAAYYVIVRYFEAGQNIADDMAASYDEWAAHD